MTHQTENDEIIENGCRNIWIERHFHIHPDCLVPVLDVGDECKCGRKLNDHISRVRIREDVGNARE